MSWPESISRRICVVEQLTQVYGSTYRHIILSDNSHHSTQTVSRDYRRHSNRRCSSLPFFVVHEFYLNVLPLIWGVYSWRMKQVLGMGSFGLQSRGVHNKNVNFTSRFFWWNWEHFTLNSFLYITGVHPRLAGRLRPAATFVTYGYTYCKNYAVM